jgi:pyruvate dehydrogenase E2 component (dihydrolipoamide acetyltransferase)
MAVEIVMPRLSDSMEEGTVLQWLKSPGDEVQRGDELVEIETDKANMVYEADSGGVLVEIIAGEGATLPIGETIARLGDPGDEVVSEIPAALTAAEAPSEEAVGAEASPSLGATKASVDEQASGGGTAAVAAGGGAAGVAGAVAAGGGAPGGGDAPADSSAPDGSTDGAVDAGAAGAMAVEPGGAPTSPEAVASATAAGGRVKASPIARRIARESGIDLSGLSGSGPGGRIVKADVEGAMAVPGTPAPQPGVGTGVPAAAQPGLGAALTPVSVPGGSQPDGATAPAAVAASAAPGAPAPATQGASERPETAKGQTKVVELSKLQQTVARRMAESKATAPHFYLTTTVDMSAAVAARTQIKAAATDGASVPSFNDLVIKACALALREFPRANGAYRDGRVALYSRVNVGVAVAGQDALVVPTVFDADLKGLRDIAAETRALAARVRDGSITPPELSGGTFTVSNLGMYGVTSFSAVINPPQAAILAVGAIVERPVASGGEISTAQLMDVTLASDHRILYGANGAAFLARIRALLEEPLVLAL